jgi:chromosome segregation ATPase
VDPEGRQQWMLRVLAIATALTSAFALAALTFSASARAADIATLQARVDSARKQARQLAATVVARNNAYRSAAAAAATAAARQAVLEEELREGRIKLARLERRVAVATTRYERAQRRYRRAQNQLAAALVAIYKSNTPDLTSVILRSDGFHDMLTRATYVRKINEAHRQFVERVRALRNQVRTALKHVKALKAQAAEQVKRLRYARAQIAAARQQAEQRAADARTLRATAQAALDTLHSRISTWEHQVAALQAATGQGGSPSGEVQRWFGDFAIPNYIVMCESGGNYKAYNPSSGAGGAYQFLPSTYKALGGKYGAPQNAPKWEQDRLAAKLWNNGSGAGNWECAK